MLKKLLLGLFALSLLASPSNNLSAGKTDIDLNTQIQKQNAANLNFSGLTSPGLQSGFSPIGGISPGIIIDRPTTLARTFTIVVDSAVATYESNDGEVLSSTRLNMRSRKFEIMVNKTVGVHEFYITKDGMRSCIKRVFSYLYKNVAYISEQSKEDAWRNAVDLDINNGVITKEQAENLYAEFLLLASPNSNQGTTEGDSSGVLPPYYAHQPSDQTASFYSRVEWEDRNGNYTPLPLCQAKLFINGSYVKKSSLNEYGQVFFNLDNSSKYWGKNCEVQIRVYTHSETFSYGFGSPTFVENGYNEYYMAVSEKQEVTIDNTTSLSMPIRWKYSENEETSSALSIAYALAICQEFAKDNVRDFANNPNLEAFHLSVGGGWCSNGFDFYGTSNICCYDACERWILPFRLYGLYVEGIMRMLGSNTQMPFEDDYGNYTYEENMMYSKEMSSEIVWHRSLADMFAILCYQSMEDNIGNLAPTQSIRDLMDRIINYTPDSTAGEGSILCVTTYLYNLYTGYTAKNGTYVPGRNDRFVTYFDFVFDNRFDRFDQFVNYNFKLNAPFPNKDSGVCNSSLLEDLCIAPSNITLVGEIIANTSTSLKWKAGGCASAPNNEFDLWFYGGYSESDQYHIKVTKNKYNLSNGIVTYNLTNADKNKIINLMGDEDLCYVTVGGYNTHVAHNSDDNLKTGPFYSMFVRIVKPEIINDEVIFEKEIEYNPRHLAIPYISYDSGLYICSVSTYVKFKNSCNVQFFTRGDVDSIISIREVNGPELAQNDNGGHAGNAFISYPVTANTRYEIVTSTITSIKYFNGWSQLDIVQRTNSYGSNYQITHPTTYSDIKRIDYQSYYWERPDYDPEVNYDFDRYLPFEVGSTAMFVYEPPYGGGFHMEFIYSENCTLIVMPLGQTTRYNYDYYSGSSSYVFGYLDGYINIMEGDACMVLIARDNRYGSIGAGVINQAYRLIFGLTYLDGEW